MKITFINHIEDSIFERDSVAINFDEKIVVLKRKRAEDGSLLEENVETESNELTVSIKSLCYQLYRVSNKIALLRSLRGKKLSFSNIATLLAGATVDINDVKYQKGDVDAETGEVYEHDYIQHNIKTLKLSEEAEKKLNMAIDKLSDLCL